MPPDVNHVPQQNNTFNYGVFGVSFITLIAVGNMWEVLNDLKLHWEMSFFFIFAFCAVYTYYILTSLSRLLRTT
jgi:hypothetical protein